MDFFEVSQQLMLVFCTFWFSWWFVCTYLYSISWHGFSTCRSSLLADCPTLPSYAHLHHWFVTKIASSAYQNGPLWLLETSGIEASFAGFVQNRPKNEVRFGDMKLSCISWVSYRSEWSSKAFWTHCRKQHSSITVGYVWLHTSQKGMMRLPNKTSAIGNYSVEPNSHCWSSFWLLCIFAPLI